MLIIAPLSVAKSRAKNFTLNLNVYRNTHYQTLNKVKVNYKTHLSKQISELPFLNKIRIVYTLYTGTRRKCDIANVLSIHDKFFCDALVELGKIQDDDYEKVPEVTYRFGGIDRENPRVEIQLIQLE